MTPRSQLPTVHERDDPGMAAWASLLRVHAQAVRAIDVDVRAATGLPLSQYDVLLELAPHPDGLRMQQLSELVVLSRSRVSRLVDEMVHEALVEKRPDPDDGRATRAVATAAGQRALRRAAPAYREAIERHFASKLDRAQLDRLGEILGALVEPPARESREVSGERT